MRTTSRQPFEQRVRRAAFAAVPLATAGGVAGMIRSPHLMAESETVQGVELWLGALAGLAMMLAFYVVPVLLFALALRRPTPRRLLAVSIAAPIAAVMGIMPFVAALIDGWHGVEPIAVVTAALLGVVNCAVFAAAVRMRRAERTPAPR